MARVLSRQPYFGDNLWDMPQVWCNSYDDPPELSPGEVEQSIKDGTYHFQGQVHLVARLKFERDWRITKAKGDRQMEWLEKVKRGEVEGVTLENLEGREAIRRVTEEWWSGDHVGADKFRFGLQ